MSNNNIKSLLQSKKASTRLIHPYAKYDSSSRLTCSLCSLQIKHENLWSSHLLTKSHRSKVNIAKSLEEKLEREKEKEKEVEGGGEGISSSVANGKRKRIEEEVGRDGKKVKEIDDEEEQDADEDEDEDEEGTEQSTNTGALPDDFFSDKSMRPVTKDPSPEEEEEVEEQVIEEAVEAEVDPEWAAFEASLANEAAPPPLLSSISTAKATIFSAPIMYEFGAPKVLEEGEEESKPEGEEAEEEEVEEAEEEKAERLDREQREELLQRITEETTEQEMADEKVAVLKRRLEKIKEAREARKKKA